MFLMMGKLKVFSPVLHLNTYKWKTETSVTMILHGNGNVTASKDFIGAFAIL